MAELLKDFYGPFEKSLNKVNAGALIAAAHDLSEVAQLRCPGLWRKAGTARRLLWSISSPARTIRRSASTPGPSRESARSR